MLKAVVTNIPGSPEGALLLGLTPENWTRLMANQPIPVQAAQLGLTPLVIIITAGVTVDAILADAQAADLRLDDSTLPPARPAADLRDVVEAVADVWPGEDPRLVRRVAAAALDTAWRHAAGDPVVARFVCPVCRTASTDHGDVRSGYCGRCRDVTGVS